jgi:Tfp pilus assembly protein PilV
MAACPARRSSRRGVSLIDVVFSTMLMALAVLLFTALYPTSARSARMTADYAQASVVLQHKVDQMRAMGYGRLNYAQMLNAGVIDASPTTQPFRFEVADQLSTSFWSPIGTISFSTVSTDLLRATVRLEWLSAPGRTQRSSHQVEVLIANE